LQAFFAAGFRIRTSPQARAGSELATSV
jgi:hypothetical protein